MFSSIESVNGNHNMQIFQSLHYLLGKKIYFKAEQIKKTRLQATIGNFECSKNIKAKYFPKERKKSLKSFKINSKFYKVR